MITNHYEYPDAFYEISDYDKYKRELKWVYIKQNDSSFIRGRMTHIRAGNIFKLVNKDHNLEGPIYRALDDAIYDKKSNEVYVNATLLDDYNKEINHIEYRFDKPINNLCR